MRRSTPIKIGEIWSGFIRENPAIARRLAEARIPEVWRSLVGDGINTLTVSLSVANGILNVTVSSSVARQELFMRRKGLTDAINRELGMHVIRDIVIR